MFLRFARLAILFVPLWLACSATTAQTASAGRENSPYSRFGLGEIRGGTPVALRGMGWISSAYASPTVVNPDNPASYGSLMRATYEGAGEGRRRTLTSAAGESTTAGTGLLSYLRVGLPIGQGKGGVAFGLQPETRVYYRVQGDTASPAGIGRTLAEYNGEGGLNYAFIGGAARYRGFALGLNAGYLFGSIRNTAYQSFFDADSTRTNASEFSRFLQIGGIYTKLGAHWGGKISPKLTARVGGTATLRQDVTAREQETSTAFRFVTGSAAIRDTAVNTGVVPSTLDLPLSYSFGIHVSDSGKWTLGLEAQRAMWSDYKASGNSDASLGDAYRLGIGGEYVPDAAAREYGPRVTYRAGFVYGRDYIQPRGTSLNYYFGTVGASLPFGRSLNQLHAALEIGRRGTLENGLLREGFARLALGVSLNDRWFIKRRYD